MIFIWLLKHITTSDFSLPKILAIWHDSTTIFCLLDFSSAKQLYHHCLNDIETIYAVFTKPNRYIYQLWQSASSISTGSISGKNIAKYREAHQSSNYGDYTADFAVDGNENSKLKTLTCMHTNSEANPWWTLDLAAVVRIQKVYLTLNLLIKPWPIKILGDASSTLLWKSWQLLILFSQQWFQRISYQILPYSVNKYSFILVMKTLINQQWYLHMKMLWKIL